MKRRRKDVELLIVILAELLVVKAVVIPWVKGIEKLKDDPDYWEWL